MSDLIFHSISFQCITEINECLKKKTIIRSILTVYKSFFAGSKCLDLWENVFAITDNKYYLFIIFVTRVIILFILANPRRYLLKRNRLKNQYFYFISIKYSFNFSSQIFSSKINFHPQAVYNEILFTNHSFYQVSRTDVSSITYM